MQGGEIGASCYTWAEGAREGNLFVGKGRSARLSYFSVLEGMPGRHACPSPCRGRREKFIKTQLFQARTMPRPDAYWERSAASTARGSRRSSRREYCHTNRRSISGTLGLHLLTSIERGPSAASCVFVKTTVASSILLNKPCRRSFDDRLEEVKVFWRCQNQQSVDLQYVRYGHPLTPAAARILWRVQVHVRGVRRFF